MRLNLSYNEDSSDLHGQIEFLRSRLYVVRTLVPTGYEAYFQEQARFVSAHSSTAIEGNQLSEEAALRVLAEGADQSNPDEIEKVNLNEAYELVSQLAVDGSTRLDEGIMRTLNSIVLKGLPDQKAKGRGRYRLVPNLVVDSVTRELRYRPPPPPRVPELMDGFVQAIREWTDKGVEGPTIAALAHFGLISIHPFEDGNGRTARLIADMVLLQTGWAADGMLSVSQVLLDHRAEYYDSLRQTQGLDFQEDIDVTPFITFHSQMIGMAAAVLEERVVNFKRRLDSWMRQLHGVLNPRQATGLMYLLDVGIPLSSAQYAHMTNISQATAVTDLSGLVELGILSRIGSGRATRYMINTIWLTKMEQ